jgi:hypothetical protein
VLAHAPEFAPGLASRDVYLKALIRAMCSVSCDVDDLDYILEREERRQWRLSPQGSKRPYGALDSDARRAWRTTMPRTKQYQCVTGLYNTMTRQRRNLLELIRVESGVKLNVDVYYLDERDVCCIFDMVLSRRALVRAEPREWEGC